MIKKFSQFKDKEVQEEVQEEVISKPLEQEQSIINSEEQVITEPKNKVKPTKSGDKVEFYGKVAKFPKNTESKKANNFLENIKVKKTKLWYLMTEKQVGPDGAELQMIKYNQHAGVNLQKFMEDLTAYYVAKYPSLLENFAKLRVEGDAKFSSIKNIPDIEIEGKKMVSLIMGDLVRLLSK